MSDIITLSSSDDESSTPSPKKRIKPSFLGLSPHVTITRVTKKTKQIKKMGNPIEIHELLSDDEIENLTYQKTILQSQTIDDDDVEVTEYDNKITEDDVKITEDDDVKITYDVKITEDDDVKITEDDDVKITDDDDVKVTEDDVKVTEHGNGLKNGTVIDMEVLKNFGSSRDIEVIEDLRDMDNILVVEDSCEILNESSEESSDKEESSGKENKTENENNSCNLSEPSASTSKSNNPNTILLRDFLSIFKETIKGTKFESLENKIPSLKKYYDKYEEDQGESIDFKQVIEASIAKATQSTGKAVVGFKDIYEYLQEISSADSVEVTAEDRIKLKKLGRTIKLLVSKIKQLEEAEINFDDEEDSTYLQLDRYTRRLNLVHQKYCVLLERNPYSGRLTYSKLDFSDSNYNEINRAISKKFKNNKKFPSYFEMKNFIEKVAEENNLELSEPIIKAESVHCFTKLGELLQNRRRRELYDSHYTLIKDNEDPAKDDPSLNSILQKQYSEGQSKVEKLVQEYVKKQEYGVGSDSTGLEADSTGDDSDKSDNVDSNSEDKDTIDSET